MRAIGLIVRHELRLVRRNSGVVVSGCFGFATIILILLAAIREGAAGPQLTGVFLVLIVGAAAAMPMTLAIHAFVGEKERRTMEALLLLPITLPRLIAGKAAVTMIVSLLLIVLVFTSGIIGVWALGEPEQQPFLLNGLTLYVASVLGPLFVTLYTLVALIISGRSKNVRAALNMGVLVAAPVFAFPLAMWFGWVGLSRAVLVFATAIVAMLCVIAFLAAFSLLRSEALLAGPGR